jgi:toxin ParE1/3/4
MPVRISRRAFRDLLDIQRHIARDRPKAAMRMGAALYDACLSLEDSPRRGRIGRKPGTLELWTIRPYVIVYEIWTDRVVHVNAILHGARDRR